MYQKKAQKHNLVWKQTLQLKLALLARCGTIKLFPECLTAVWLLDAHTKVQTSRRWCKPNGNCMKMLHVKKFAVRWPSGVRLLLSARPCSAAGCSVGGRISRQRPFLSPSHTGLIILSAVNVSGERGARHNKNSGGEALGPGLGARPIILHRKRSSKRRQVARHWNHHRHTNDMMKLCNKQVPFLAWVWGGCWRRQSETREGEQAGRFSTMIECVCWMRNWCTVGSTTGHGSHPSWRETSATVCLRTEWMRPVWKRQGPEI